MFERLLYSAADDANTAALREQLAQIVERTHHVKAQLAEHLLLMADSKEMKKKIDAIKTRLQAKRDEIAANGEASEERTRFDD